MAALLVCMRATRLDGHSGRSCALRRGCMSGGVVFLGSRACHVIRRKVIWTMSRERGLSVFGFVTWVEASSMARLLVAMRGGALLGDAVVAQAVRGQGRRRLVLRA